MNCQPGSIGLVDRCAHALQRALWPPKCMVCEGRGLPPHVDMCAGCRGELPVLQSACRRCANPMPPELEASLVCGQCLRWPPRYDTAFAAFHYARPIDQLVRSFKYRHVMPAGRLLAHLFSERLLARAEPLPQAIVPVPLARRRYRQRGFNQAIALCNDIEKLCNVPMRTDVLVRTRDTEEQAGLELVARRRNVRGAFALRRNPRLDHIAILDDVMTTGSTMNEVARELRRAGVKCVEAWAIARASR